MVDEFTRSGIRRDHRPCHPAQRISRSRARPSGTNSRHSTPRLMEKLHCPVEIREADNGPMLHGVLIQEGRAASVRAEVFAPLSLVWASDGISIRAKHLGAEDSRAIPTRDSERINKNRSPRKRSHCCRVQRGAQVSFNRVSRCPRNPKQVGGFARDSTRLSFPALPSYPILNTCRQPPKSGPRSRRVWL